MVPLAANGYNFCIGKWIFATLKIVFLLTLCYANENDQEDEFCAMEASLDLTHASENVSGFLDESGYYFPREATRFKAGIRHGCICDIKPCLAYCPESNTMGAGNTHVADDLQSADYSAIPRVYTTNLTLDNDEKIRSSKQWFHIVKWDPCSEDAYLLVPKNYPQDKFYLLRNGSLFIPQRVQLEARFKNFKTSCLRLEGDDSTYTPKICAPKAGDPSETATYIGRLVSVPFLISTVIVYSILPELNNIHGTTLRCYLSCLILTNVAQAASKITRQNHNIVSLCFGYTTHFSYVSSFFWLNVMSFDIWWTLGRSGSLQRICANHDRKKFIYYSIYAWGIGVALTAICIGTEVLPSNQRSIDYRLAEAFYFWGPIGLTIACNVCLFISTIVKIVQHNKRMRHELSNRDSMCHDEHKHWFSLHLKLFVVMGISWSTEIISHLWKTPTYLWYVTDMLNVLQGIPIFVIFVCKKNIWLSLRKRFHNAQFCSSSYQLLGYICKSRSSSSASKTTVYFAVQKIQSSDSNESSTLARGEILDRASSSE